VSDRLVFKPVRLPLERFAFEIADGLPDFCDDRSVGSSVEAHRLDVRRRDIRRNLLPPWGGKPITEITDLDVLVLIRAKKAKSPVMARNLLHLVRRLFSWAIDQRTYGLTINPAASLRPSKIIGEKVKGDRVLTDDELFALWRGAGRLGYPYCGIYRLLMLTGLVDADWLEFDLPKREWTIKM
jgi:hypothetical protein